MSVRALSHGGLIAYVTKTPEGQAERRDVPTDALGVAVSPRELTRRCPGRGRRDARRDRRGLAIAPRRRPAGSLPAYTPTAACGPSRKTDYSAGGLRKWAPLIAAVDLLRLLVVAPKSVFLASF